MAEVDLFMKQESAKRLPHLVFGGELIDIGATELRDLGKIDVVGLFHDYASAYVAWKAPAQATFDDANSRCFIAPLHRLPDPSKE